MAPDRFAQFGGTPSTGGSTAPPKPAPAAHRLDRSPGAEGSAARTAPRFERSAGRGSTVRTARPSTASPACLGARCMRSGAGGSTPSARPAARRWWAWPDPTPPR